MRSKLRATRVCLSIVLLIFGACSEEILHDLSEHQANAVQLTLAKDGISARKEKMGSAWSISVDSKETPNALAALELNRVVRSPRETLESGSGSFIRSREERGHYIERSLAANLEATLERIPGILEARVHINLDFGSRFTFGKEKNQRTASVLLVHDPEASFSEEGIRELVSGAGGMRKNAVSVIVVKTFAYVAKKSLTRSTPPLASVQNATSFDSLWHFPFSIWALAAIPVLVPAASAMRRIRETQNSLKRGADESS